MPQAKDQAPPEPSASLSEAALAMQGDWNARAREDAHYYVAFGRKNQGGEEFFETGQEQVHGLVAELGRLKGPAPYGAALEIGCGPGRLMRPLARYFGEIHGVDISDEMVARAQANLSQTPNAHAHHTPGSNLDPVSGLRFDFIYSYAVFQHIPSHAAVMGYLRQAAKLLQPGGIIRAQINGLPQTGEGYTTWSGVRIAAGEIAELARTEGLHLLALEGTGTQYMWTTLRQPASAAETPAGLRIRRVTNAYSGEPVAPVAGRFGALSVGIEGLGEEAGLNDLAVQVEGRDCALTYLGPLEASQGMGALRQLNLLLPGGLPTGLGCIALRHVSGIHAEAHVRLIPAPPVVVKLLSVTDGVDLVSGPRIVSGYLKATLEELADPGPLQIRIGGVQVPSFDSFRTDPRLPKWEINFAVPAGVAAGDALVAIHLGQRLIGQQRVQLEHQRDSADADK